MNAPQQQYRACFASFVSDLQGLVDAAIRQAIAAELERLTSKQKAATRTARRRAAPKENGTEARTPRPRGRPKQKPPNGNGVEVVSAEPSPSKPATVPPLFVHKRSRDGSIQHLSRQKDGDGLPRQSSAAG